MCLDFICEQYVLLLHQNTFCRRLCWHILMSSPSQIKFNEYEKENYIKATIIMNN